MVSCAYRSCNSRDGVDKKETSGITFHRFPKDPARQKLWVQYVNRGVWKPTKYSVLCSKHFSESYMDRTSKCYVRLKKNAIPTVGLTEELLQKELAIPPVKVRILSNILVTPPTVSQGNLEIPMSSPLSIQVPSTSTNSVFNASVTTEPVVSTSEINAVSPRKRKLLTRLNETLCISRKRKEKLDLLRKKLFRREKRIAGMKNIISDLRKMKYIQEEALEILTKLGGPLELVLRQYKKATNQSLPRCYSEDLKAFALTLHYHSPAAYNYVRRTFNTCLPHPRTLCRWYQNCDGQPGFTTESFEVLKLKASSEKKPLICSLIIDEMSIRQHEEWVPGQDKCYGYVDMGTGSQEVTLAKDAFVFLLNCINGYWKIPIGYFLIAGITAEQKKGLVLQCLEKCHEIGVQVVSLTCDGPPVNLTMAKKLGCTLQHRKLQTSFKHPSTNEEVAFLLDPSHMLKLIRNTLGEKGSLVDENNEIVSWQYLKELNKLQETESFHMANKLRSEHINFCKHKMKVRLATQVFSESVATALSFCGSELNMKQFLGVNPTVKFILVMNNLFDILNSRNLLQSNYKKPLSKRNYDEIECFLNTAEKYISSLKTHVGGPLLLDTDRHTGFLGLKVCIYSLKMLFQRLVLNNTLQFLPAYKFSQDHIELFFGSIRAHGGFNNNPTARQFQSAYKKLLVHVELRENFRGNCIPLEQLPILKCDPVHQINSSTRDSRILGTNENPGSIVDEVNNIMDHDYLPDPLSEFSKYIIAYIAGYVVHFLKKKIVCEECASALISTSRDLYLFSFIDKKNKNGLQYPSTDVLEICVKAERIIKNRILTSNRNLLSGESIVALILREFVASNIFSNLTTHTFDQSVLDNHRVLLIKAVASRYTNVRMFFLSKINKSESIRHRSNKIVLFKGQ